MSAELFEMDELGMKLALAEADKASELDEVPVGAVILRAGQVVGRGHNLTRMAQDPTAHAEMRRPAEKWPLPLPRTRRS